MNTSFINVESRLKSSIELHVGRLLLADRREIFRVVVVVELVYLFAIDSLERMMGRSCHFFVLANADKHLGNLCFWGDGDLGRCQSKGEEE